MMLILTKPDIADNAGEVCTIKEEAMEYLFELSCVCV